jgi:hypothetical protein
MIGNSFARLTGSKRNLLALMASSAVFTAGCANMATTASNTTPLGQAATLSGKIHGGNQPVIGAAVTLYYAGQKGSPGTPASVAAVTTTDSAGSFAFIKDGMAGNTADNGTTDTFSCPVGGDPLVYVISKGGNTQNNGDPTQSNAAAAFISVYGTCNELSAANHVDMTEVTTVATMAAVQQFFNPFGVIPDQILADGTGQQYKIVTQLPATIALLADPSAGTAVTSTTLNAAATGNINPAVSVTATPEPGKVNLLANILSACINQATAAAANCSSLFTAAVPPNPAFTANFGNPSFAPAIDTLQAIYYMLTNPSSGGTDNQATLFGLAGGVSGPYQPALATQPTDWTIAVNYVSTSTCGTTTGGSGGFISGPIDINIDAADNVWIANSQTGTGNLSEISGAGVPTTCVFLGSGGSKGGATIDSASNVWIGSGANLYRYNPNTSVSTTFPTTVSPIGVTADGIGNVYFTAVNGTVGSLYQLPGAAISGGAVTALQISGNVGSNPVRLMPDFQGNAVQGNIFVTSGTTIVSEVSPSTGTGNLNGFLTSTIPTSGDSYGISLSHDNRLFISSIDSGAIDGLVLSSGTYTNISGFPFTTPGTIGIATPTSISVDGRLNVWVPNNTNGTGTGSVSELGAQGPTGLSPSTGFQKDASYLTSGRALAVDQAGNVWVAGDNANFITEIVGAGVPIFQPYSLGLKNGRFQSIP